MLNLCSGDSLRLLATASAALQRPVHIAETFPLRRFKTVSLRGKSLVRTGLNAVNGGLPNGGICSVCILWRNFLTLAFTEVSSYSLTCASVLEFAQPNPCKESSHLCSCDNYGLVRQAGSTTVHGLLMRPFISHEASA
jgi:hypothetical protein